MDETKPEPGVTPAAAGAGPGAAEAAGPWWKTAKAQWAGPEKAGSFVKRKGNQFVVNLLMKKPNGKCFDTPYGSYKDENMARKTCWSRQRVQSCQQCKRTRRECDLSDKM